ncbi:MAG: TIM barrel protein [Verrucomicrobiota bacterium]
MKKIVLFGLLVGVFQSVLATASAEIPSNFQRENLVAWCIAHRWDAKGRDAAERAELMADLGFGRYAYNWRASDNPQFEEEILECRKRGIEFFAFWNEHETAFDLFQKYKMQPQIWKVSPSPKVEGQAAKVEAAAKRMYPYAKRAQEIGCSFGLYNHMNWGGHPENMIAVCEALREMGCENVGIVYNFHHSHEEMDRFAEYLDMMMPYLMCLNLNGMADKDTVDHKKLVNKILPIGSGKHEQRMLQAVLDSGYDGPVGILDHIVAQDSEKSLRDNLEGLDTFFER